MLSKKLTIDRVPELIKNKRVLMRVDFNVPMKDGAITDPKRIIATLPTIQYCLENGASGVTLMSHMGRPQGSRQEKFSMAPLVPALEDFLERKVKFMTDCVGEEVENHCGAATGGQVTLLENLRFHPSEEGKGVINGEKVKAP